MRFGKGVFLVLVLIALPAHATSVISCLVAGQKPVSVFRLYFGQNIEGKKFVTPGEWRNFLARDVTPRFPDGFTVYDAMGQWQNPGTHRIDRERTKVLEIATVESEDVEARLAEVEAIYRKRFHQQSVGVAMMQGCGAF
jgi:Protein of unknown function (DUF3574)